MIKAVVFDMDGVLIDSEPVYQSIKRDLLRRFGLNMTDQQAKSFAGEKLRDTIPRLFPHVGESLKRQILDTFVNESIAELPYAQVLNRHAVPVLSRLRDDGYKVALASSSPLIKIEMFFKRCDTEKYFDLVTTGEMFEKTKPDPAIYLYTAERLGLPPSGCAAVEDSDIGLEAASSAGYYVICKRDNRFNFKQSSANVWVDDLDEITDILRRINL
jgi:HAD superfamily hydrolase (TIGR01509 family)